MHGAFGFRVQGFGCAFLQGLKTHGDIPFLYRVALDFRTCVLKTQVSGTRVLDAGTRVPRQLRYLIGVLTIRESYNLGSTKIFVSPHFGFSDHVTTRVPVLGLGYS